MEKGRARADPDKDGFTIKFVKGMCYFTSNLFTDVLEYSILLDLSGCLRKSLHLVTVSSNCLASMIRCLDITFNTPSTPWP